MNLITAKVIAQHALLIGGLAAAATVTRDLFVLATKQ